MTTRKSGSRRSGKTNASGTVRLRDSLRDKGRLRAKRRRQDRRSLLETLEQRQLLAGPQLIGIQPNEGSLLMEGTELNTAPRELVFQFDDATEIDPATLAGIQITRAGDDNVFEAAQATTDLGTGGTVLVQFRAVETGIRGNGIRVQFTTRSRNDTSLPEIRVDGETVSIELNRNSSRTTTVDDLLRGIRNSVASDLIEANRLRGNLQTPIGETVASGSELVLSGANAAKAITDLGTNNAIRVRVLATEAGSSGRGRRLIVEQRNFGGPALPVVLTEGRDVRVLVNSAPGNATTAAELIAAVNNNRQASELLQLQLEAGDGDTPVGNRVPSYSPLTLTGASDVRLEPGFVGVGDSPNEVVFRFAEPLPDDLYQIDILGTGPTALQNVAGELFGDGVGLTRKFTLNLGPQVLAVVPEPVRRLADGTLRPEAGVIEVHFSEEVVAPPSELDFYRLFYSALGEPDEGIRPFAVEPVAGTHIVRLKFAQRLGRPDPNNPNTMFAGARLRIGSDEVAPTVVDLGAVGSDPGDQLPTAFVLDDLGTGESQSVVLSSEISSDTRYGLQFPGGPEMPGVRQIRPDDPTRLNRTVPLDYLRRGPDDADGISRVFYDFASSFLGDNPTSPGIDNDTTYFNVITEEQKQRVREVLSLFSEYLGIQFVETNGGPVGDAFFTIAVGDLHGADPAASSGPGGLAVVTGDRNGDGFDDIGVLDFQDFDASTDDQFGGEFFRGAMLLVGQILGYGYADDLPQPVTQSTLSVFNPGGVNEPTFPSAADIVNGRFLYRPESTDIDLYRFDLSQSGTVSIQTIAERLSEASLLDSALRLYKVTPVVENGVERFEDVEEVSANDDYFGSDSLIEMELDPGTYVLGVSSSGNTTYDPAISGTGMGGRSEGAYDLRINFQADGNSGLKDTTGVALDGDSDGSPGGIYNFWFAASDPTATLYVDKAANSAGDGTLNRPFANLGDAIAAATPGQTVRVVANGGLDDLVETAQDNFSYQIGVDSLGNPLPDGESLDVPHGVTLVIDAGVIVKMQRARVGIGSTSATIDRSGAALQLLGTPTLRDSSGRLLRDANGELVPGSVYFTSLNDDTIGTGNTPAFTSTPQPGDWGGLDFRGNLDAADANRTNHETDGLFLNHIQFADLRYGGGRVSVDGRTVVVSPVDMAVTRPTVVHSRITNSADAAIAATPDSFAETRFDEMDFQADGLFTPDYRRVGPDIHGNFIVDNSINGLFVRVVTRSGASLQPLTTQARFDDTDIPHILTENLVIQGTPGGPVLDSQAPSVLLVRLSANSTGSVPAGEYRYKLTNVDVGGQESPASASTLSVTLPGPGSIKLSQLPKTPAGGEFVARRLYRATLTEDPDTGELVEGPFELVASLNSSSTSFTDNNANPGAPLVEGQAVYRARLDARLAIDPGTTIKLDSARIDVQFGAQLLAEGSEGLPVVFTSLSDQRYGGSGTFDTNSQGPNAGLAPGDWGGIYVGHTSKASFDHAVIAAAGGTTRIEGGFASFNPIEVHQAQVRVANSVFEQNADGRGNPAGDRVGRMDNAPGTIFVRGAAPIIVGNQFTGGGGAAMTFDINSLSSFAVSDWGRSRGPIDRVDPQGNAGPLVRDNALGNNDINGLHVRGGELATQGIWDDTDIVHVVTDTIEVPNQFVYGGLRLESDARSSLVVKFQNGDDPATIVVGGTLLTAADQLRDIPDRIGGALQVIGHPDFPVVLTSLLDDSAGAGFDPQGRPQVDTNNDGVFGAAAGPQAPTEFVVLPTGPEVNNGLLIDNDVPRTVDGFFEVQPGPGGDIGFRNAQTATGAVSQLVASNLIFQFSNYVIVDGNAERLGSTTVTQQPTLIADDRVESRGTLAGDNGDVDWIATTFFRDGVTVMFNEIRFESSGPLGDIRFVNYLDEDVLAPNDDILYTTGTPGEADFRAFTIDSAERIGFAHGGFYENGDNQDNATYVGWSADRFRALANDIEANAATYSIPGVIDVATLGTGTDPDFGTTFGPSDVTTAFAWDVDATATSSRITSFLELIPSDPAKAGGAPPAAGDWTGLVVREAASDRNVSAVSEAEHDGAVSPGTNSTPGGAQFLGELAPDDVSGDENRRLGFVVDGYIAEPGDVDVYSFVAEAGTQVWLDIDRTNLALDSVVELIDANGEILALSDDSMAEEADSSKLTARISDRLDADAVHPMAEIGERTETQQLTISENIVDAEGFLTIGLEGSDETVRIRVENFVANPAGSLRLAIASRFRDQLGPVDVSLVRREGRQVDPADPANVLAEGDDFVLEVRFNNDLFLGSDVPDLLVTTDDLTIPGGGTVDVALEEVIDPSKLQDLYSINPRDAGMRMILPGETGARNLYHVRVRSSNAASATEAGNLTDPSMVRSGLTAGEYQLQVRLRELDEFPGTQVRFADVRYATNGIQVIGQPFHSPLLGEEYEQAGANELLADAQPLGAFGVGDDGTATNNGPLNSDLLAKSVAGVLDSATDVDWYQFDVQYENLTRDAASLFMSTVFDLDYADNFARADMSLYVFDESGRLIMLGTESNIADDQPRSGQGADSTDLSRGSAGTLDPYIGTTELSEGSYFVAVANHSQIPLPMDQFYAANSANPLLRLEPIDSVVRIAEDRIGSSGGGTAANPQVPVLFDTRNAQVPLSLNDLIVYTIGSTGSGAEQTIQLINPFTGQRYGEVGRVNQDIADFAFLPNGELFGYSRDLADPNDAGWNYFKISSEDGSLTDLGPTQLETFEIEVDDDGTPTAVVSDDGVHPEAITFRDNSLGFFVGNRPTPRPGPAYFSNILYQFDPQTGEPFSGPAGDRQDLAQASGAGTQVRERGFIATEEVGERVTGIAFIGNVLYAVSDQGGLYEVTNPTATVQGAIGSHVATIMDSQGNPIRFTGVSTGPPQAEGGRFADLLFGTTSDGRVYAFDRTGELQPVFVGGRTNIDVNGNGGVRGIQFSTLDYNLWHTTGTRGNNPGHGIEDTFSNTRFQRNGGTSFYFGYEDDAFGALTSPAQDPLQVPRQDGQAIERTFNFPGGAEGALESNPFDLAGYAAEDLPYLYFTYFLETENTDGLNDQPDEAAATLDAFRVYVLTEDGTEHLVATNNSARDIGLADDEFDDPTNSFRFGDTYDDDIDVDVQELFDNTNSWRQARVALSEFAGQENLRLRIDFSTAGQIGTRDIGLRTLAGDRLRDGQQIIVGNETFELAMGQKVILPPGSVLADFYAAADAGTSGSAPDTRVTIDVAGTTFVLNDGFRNVAPSAQEVNVPLSDLAQLNAVEIADRLASVLADNRPPATVPVFDLAVEGNDELATATALPDIAGDMSLSGLIELQDARDVDLFRVDASAGTIIEAAATRQPGSAVNPLVRLFDAEGNELDRSSSSAGIQFTVSLEGAYYIGYSSDQNSDYDPTVAGSGTDGDVGGYAASIDIRRDYRVLTVDNRIEITGGFEVTTPADSPLTIEGSLGSNGIPVEIDSAMTADEVAVVLRNAIAEQFAGGEQGVYPIHGSKVSLIGLTVGDPGPFGQTGSRWGENFGAEGASRARNNVFEGVYVDDFIIGFAERGELATGANTTNSFIADPSPNLTSPPQPVSDLVTGSYQLEIRDASEYVASNFFARRQFRAFDTNARLSLSQSITARPATDLVDGTTFTIGDGNATVTFEFDLVESNSGVSAGNVRIPYTFNAVQPGTGVVRPQTASEVAQAIVAAINSNQVQLVLDVSALRSSGVGATDDARIDLFGTSLIEDPSDALAAVDRGSGRGDQNRDRGAQGVILIENSRFIFSEQFGVDLLHDTSADVAGNATDSLVRYPRNLVELNTEQLAPGVVVASNVLAYNGLGGLQITGIGAGQAAANPVPFDRIINNTIIGGSVEPGEAATAATHQGIVFDLGATAFADQVVSYSPNAGGGPRPDLEFRDASTALGPPQLAGRGAEPDDGDSTVSLGHGGVLVLAFTNNLLTGSGDALPDLAIFEAGAVESVRVEISRDGNVYHDVGIVGGASNVLDIDAAGFGPQDRFAFVRLTDLRQGASGSSTIGADIDAVGAISSVTSDQFTAGGTGVTVRRNAAPTLLNNVVANSEIGVNIDGTSGSTVLGGTTFYRNTEDTSAGVSLGQFAQKLDDAEQVFVGAGELIFIPASGSSIIDSSINSLQDRSSLVTVRSPLGLPPSPILAPTFDVNGQLRVDDPNVQSPFGSGEIVFKDRGAADRADTTGPRAILISPRAPEVGLDAGTARVIGGAPHAFEIQLVDGIASLDAGPGVGIDDRSVSSESLLLLKNGIPQIEGIDYRFGYNPSTNTIRLTALAGVFERDSAYVVRLLDDSDAVLRSVAGTQVSDGDVFNIVDRQGGLTRFEYETGIRVTLPTFDDSTDPDGLTFAISDGPRSVTFELDTDGTTTFGNVPIRITTEESAADVLALITSTINGTALQVTATALPNGEIGLMGTRSLTAVDPLDSGATVTGAIGTSVGFGIGIPNNGLLADGIADGDSFVIRRGAVQEATFEFDTNGTLTNPDAVRIDIAGTASLDGIADAMVRAIGGAGLGLNPVNVGEGRVVLNGDVNHSIDLTNSNLNQLGLPGERATVPVVIPPASTAQEAAQIIAQTIDNASLPGVSTSIADTRVFVNGTRGITGAGAVDLVAIQDTAGNRLQSNQPDGRTELRIFVQANRFRHFNPELFADVNDSGSVTPLDALAIINVLNAGGTSIALPPPPGISLPPYPDVNGDGVISPSDALGVINALNRLSRASSAGEGESTAFVPNSRGVMASVPTALGEPQTVGVPLMQTESLAEGEHTPQTQPEIVSPRTGKAASFDSSSVFDSAESIALDEILGQLVDRPTESASDTDELKRDAVFAEFGR